jgi:hypothetical protein
MHNRVEKMKKLRSSEETSRDKKLERIISALRKENNKRRLLGHSVPVSPPLDSTDTGREQSLIYIGGIAGLGESSSGFEWADGYASFAGSAATVAHQILEENSFYIFRTDTNTILASGVQGFEAAKARANQIRKQQGLRWDQVKFKVERGNQSVGSVPNTLGGSTGTPQKKIRFGVSADGMTFSNGYGKRSRVDYSHKFNPSKGRRFRGYYDKHGNFHDID